MNELLHERSIPLTSEQALHRANSALRPSQMLDCHIVSPSQSLSKVIGNTISRADWIQVRG